MHLTIYNPFSLRLYAHLNTAAMYLVFVVHDVLQTLLRQLSLHYLLLDSSCAHESVYEAASFLALTPYAAGCLFVAAKVYICAADRCNEQQVVSWFVS